MALNLVNGKWVNDNPNTSWDNNYSANLSTPQVSTPLSISAPSSSGGSSAPAQPTKEQQVLGLFQKYFPNTDLTTPEGQAGVDYWVNDLNTGQSITDVENSFKTIQAQQQAPAQPVAAQATPQEVQQNLTNLFGQTNSDQAGIDYWVNSGLTGQDLTNAITQSGKQLLSNPDSLASYTQTYGAPSGTVGSQYAQQQPIQPAANQDFAEIQGYMQELFGRTADLSGADLEGLQYWANSGLTGQALKDAMAQSGSALLTDPTLRAQYQDQFGAPTGSVGGATNVQSDLGLNNAYNQLINGDPAQNQYLQGALQKGVNQAKNAYSDLESQSTRNLLQNVLPSLRNSAISNGQMGGSRQGIAEGMALQDFNTGLQTARDRYTQSNLDAIMQAQAAAFNSGQDRSLTAMNKLGDQQVQQNMQNALLGSNLQIAGMNNDTSRYTADTAANTSLSNAATAANTSRYTADTAANTSLSNAATAADTSRFNAGLGATTAANQLDAQVNQWGIGNNQNWTNTLLGLALFGDSYNQNNQGSALNTLGGFVSGTGQAPVQGAGTNVAGSTLAGATTGLGLANSFNLNNAGSTSGYNSSGQNTNSIMYNPSANQASNGFVF